MSQSTKVLLLDGPFADEVRDIAGARKGQKFLMTRQIPATATSPAKELKHVYCCVSSHQAFWDQEADALLEQ